MAQNPTSILFARLADAYLVGGDVSRATGICRRGLRYRPSYATGHLVLGRCHQAAGRTEEARQEFLKVLQLDSDNLAALLYLGRTELALGNLPQGLVHLEQALRLDPFNVSLADEVAGLRQTTGGGEAPAEETVTAAEEQETVAGSASRSASRRRPTRVTPEDVAPLFSLTLADLYAEQGHPGAAEIVLERILSHDPGNAAARDRLEQVQNQGQIRQDTDGNVKES